MPEKNPFTYSLETYAWIISIAAVGGLVASLRRPSSWQRVASDLIASAFAGLLTFWMCEAANINPLWTAVLTGINGHLGTQGIDMLTRYVDKRFYGGAIHATQTATPKPEKVEPDKEKQGSPVPPPFGRDE